MRIAIQYVDENIDVHDMFCSVYDRISNEMAEYFVLQTKTTEHNPNVVLEKETKSRETHT